jgi:glycosyltransferase involved in cell wall biosynthesis
MMRIVFLAYSYDNLYLPDGIQNRRLAKGLKECNVQLDIVCRNFNNLHENQKNIYYIKSPDLHYIDRIMYILFPFLYPIFSVDKLIWSLFCLKYFKNRKCGYILTTYEPFSLMFLVKKLKSKKMSIIQLLYDPLFDNPYYSSSKISLQIRKKAEKYIVNTSDLLLLNSQLLYDRFCLRYSDCKEKFRKLYLCGDDNVLNFRRSLFNNKKITVVHAGNLHGHRSIIPIILVVQELQKRYEGNLSDRMSFDFYGTVRNEDMNLVTKYGLDELFHFHGFVSQDNLYPILCDADVLLIIDSLGNENCCFPSKLCEYLFTQNVVVAFTPYVSATREIMILSQNHCFTGEDILECSQLFMNFFNRNNVGDVKNNYYEEFIPYNVAKKLINFITDISNRNA